MCALVKNIGSLTVRKSAKRLGVLLFLLLADLTSAYNHKLLVINAPKAKKPKTSYHKHIYNLPGKGFSSLTPIVATNPADQIVNVCGTSYTMTIDQSTVPSGYSGPTWNNGTTGTSLTVNASGDYWWQVIGPTVVTNGDFSDGNSGFTSVYSYKNPTHSCGNGCNILGNEGTYSVYTDPHALHSAFDQFADHTNSSRTRNMLIVNGASTANQTVWKESIPIIANTDYVFSAWATSVNPAAPAILQFSINGSPLGTINLSPTLSDGTWQYFTTTWNSGSVSGPAIPIALVNQNTAANGNDFAVDDIVFAPVYRQKIHVNLNPIPVLALTGPYTACGTYDLTKTITGYAPRTYDYFFTDSAGQTVTTPTAITSSGIYTITEQNKTTLCTSLPQQTTITINPNPQTPGITSM